MVTASFEYSPNAPKTSDLINFESTSQDSDGTIQTTEWNFGDGTVKNGENVDHSYDDDGEYTVTLTVTDDQGNSASTSENINVTNTAPNVDFSFSPTAPVVGETINFNNQSLDPDGNIVSYTWQFGDGNSSNQENPTHSYSNGIEYEATLFAEDDDGQTASVTKSVVVDGTFRSMVVNSCYHIVEEFINFTVDTEIETFERQVNLIGENDGFVIDTKISISRHQIERTVEPHTAVQTGRDISFNADVFTSVSQDPKTVEKADDIVSSAGGTLEETDRKLVTINGDQFVRIAKVKDFDSLEMLLDSIDKVGLSLRTGNDFRIETSRELRLSIHRGESRREIIMYEKARDGITSDPTLRLGR